MYYNIVYNYQIVHTNALMHYKNIKHIYIMHSI